MKIYLYRSGQNYGPYSEDSIHSFLGNGLVSKNDLVWTKGQNSWVILEELLPLIGTEKSLNQEVQEQVPKIKNLVEKGQANVALDLVLGLQSQDVIAQLLEGCRIHQDNGVLELTDWMYGSTSFFFDLLILLQPEHQPKIDESIRPSNISKLTIRNGGDFKYLNVLSKFTKLESLTLYDSLYELTELSDAAAQSLSKHKGDLDLYGLTELSDTAAESLAKHQGDLYLDGLTELSDAAVKHLEKNLDL